MRIRSGPIGDTIFRTAAISASISPPRTTIPFGSSLLPVHAGNRSSKGMRIHLPMGVIPHRRKRTNDRLANRLPPRANRVKARQIPTHTPSTRRLGSTKSAPIVLARKKYNVDIRTEKDRDRSLLSIGLLTLMQWACGTTRLGN